ncbi:MAG: hypothetical protein IT330_09960 [Anaerolineae bacterium]|nr:hypothetical protein [Anaerolineae bacterium]
MLAIRILLVCVTSFSWVAWPALGRAAPSGPLASPRSSLTGLVFEDGDGDGVPGGPYDRPLSGIEVRLEAPCGSEPRLYLIAESDEDGRYRFTKVGRGCYCLHALAPVGYLETVPGGQEVQMAWGDGIVQQHAALARPGHVIGVVFEDANGNGLQEAGEEGIPAVSVQLYRDANGDGALDTNDVLAGVATTDRAEGAFAFVDRLPGRYLLTVTPPSGLVFTAADVQAFLLITGQAGGELLYYFGLRPAVPPL